MPNIHHFRIADLNVAIGFEPSELNGIELLPSFQPFATEGGADADDLFFSLCVDDALPPIRKPHRERIGRFDTGNGETVVDQLPDGGYQFIIKDIAGGDCCLLQTNKDFSRCRCALNGSYNMRCFGLNNALMLVFAFAGCHRQTLLIHASLVRCEGRGYAFIAKSGTGKSTQVSSWLRYIPGCDLMNDDNPIVRIIGQDVFVYGSPWSGKTPCYRQVKAPLGAITRIDRAQHNSVERLGCIEAFASLLPACSTMKWDGPIFNAICDNVTAVVERIGIYTLHCLPDREAAIVCHEALCNPQPDDSLSDPHSPHPASRKET